MQTLKHRRFCKVKEVIIRDNIVEHLNEYDITIKDNTVEHLYEHNTIIRAVDIDFPEVVHVLQIC